MKRNLQVGDVVRHKGDQENQYHVYEATIIDFDGIAIKVKDNWTGVTYWLNEWNLLPQKSVLLISNSSKGENLFHAWNGLTSFYIYTSKGKRGIDLAYSELSKMFCNMTLSITHSVKKDEIAFYF